MQGYDDDSFGADDPVTREQMAAIIVRAFGLLPKQGGPERPFSDQGQIAAWAKASVEIAASHGIFAGYADGAFRPKNPATRAEAVTIIARILENKEWRAG